MSKAEAGNYPAETQAAAKPAKSATMGGGTADEKPVRYTNSASPVADRLYSQKPRAATAPTTSPSDNAASPKKIAAPSEHLVRPKKPRTLPPLEKGPKLEKEAQANLCERLYSRSIEKIKMKVEKQEALLKKYQFASKTLSSEEHEEMVQRMYYGQRKHDEAMAKQLDQKYLTNTIKVPIIHKDQIEDFNKRLYYDRRTMKKDAHDKLYDKYITQTNPVYPKLSQDAQAAAVQRLTTKN